MVVVVMMGVILVMSLGDNSVSDCGVSDRVLEVVAALKDTESRSDKFLRLRQFI